MYTLKMANLIFKAYFAATPQRADMVLERCTNAVATPFGVTGAKEAFFILNCIKQIKLSL